MYSWYHVLCFSFAGTRLVNWRGDHVSCEEYCELVQERKHVLASSCQVVETLLCTVNQPWGIS